MQLQNSICELNVVSHYIKSMQFNFILTESQKFHFLIVLLITACYFAIFSQLAKLISPSDIFKLAIVSVLVPQSK